MSTHKLFTKHSLAAALAALGLAGAPLMAAASALDLIAPKAQAAEGQGSGGEGSHRGEGGGQGQGGPGMGGRGGAEGLERDVYVGEDEEDEAKGPKYMGGGRDGQQGGKPVWAQEGLLVSDLGRLSLARAPQHVIDRQLVEALASYDPETMDSFYEMTAEEAAQLLIDEYDSVLRLDSPAQNLALLQALLDTNPAVSPLPGVDPASALDLAAIFLGTASDKEMEITPEIAGSVLYILLGKEYVNDTFTWDNIVDLADKADTVRDAIATGHE